MNKLIIKSKMVTLNEYINYERSNRFKASAIKKKITTNIKLECFASYNSEFKINKFGKYDLLIHWNGWNRSDSDNIYFQSKFILDGVVNSGKLIDDSKKYINNINN